MVVLPDPDNPVNQTTIDLWPYVDFDQHNQYDAYMEIDYYSLFFTFLS